MISGRRLLATTATAAVLALAAAPAASADHVIGTAGKTGVASTGQGTCNYLMFPSRGVLRVGTPAPQVSGANTRRRTRRERTYVRYRVHFTDAFSYSTLSVSTWSPFILVRQSQMRTWSGTTLFDGDWRGNYGADIRIEWWNARRMVGWRAYRTKAFGFYDQYRVGPFGPISSCYKYTAY